MYQANNIPLRFFGTPFYSIGDPGFVGYDGAEQSCFSA